MAEWPNALIKSFYKYGSQGYKCDTEKTVPPNRKKMKDRK